MPVSSKDTTLSEAFKELGEKLKTTARQPNIHGYKPHAKQLQFHTSFKKRKLYIGGNRSGKSTAGVIEDIWWATGKHPYRETFPTPVNGRVISVDFVNGIEKTILPLFARWLPPSELRGGAWSTAYDKGARTLNFTTGSTIEFMSNDQDLDKFSGTSRHFIHMDEEPPEPIYTENTARLIDTGGSLWITMTPVDGMTWVFDQLYEPGTLAQHDQIDVIEVDMTENPHLNVMEIEQFLDSLGPDERSARVHGKFIQMGGLIYKHFDPNPGGAHVLSQYPAIPRDWIIVASLDHGFNNPTAWLWHAISPDGRAITFNEHYESGLVIEQHAVAVHAFNKKFGRAPDYYVGDPSIRNTDPITGTSILQEYIKYGLAIQLANNDVKAGLVRVARYLNERKDGQALWHVSANCHNTIKQMSRYRWKTYANKKTASQNNVQEEPHKKDDHCPDALRYFIMSRPDLVGEFQARNEVSLSNNRDYRDAFNIPTSVGAFSTIADPWNRASGDSPRTEREYAKSNDGTDWVLDEHLGGIY